MTTLRSRRLQCRGLRTTAVMLGLLTALSACTQLGPDYVRPSVALPADYPEPQSASAGVVAADWWRLYGDAQLDTLVQAARARNADIRLALAQVQEAEAALREVDAAYLPQVDLSFTNQNTRISAAGATPVSSTVPLVRFDRRLAASTSFELDFWGRLGRSVEAARGQLMSTRYARDVVAMTLASTTAQAYFSLRSVDAQLVTARSSLATREGFLKLAEGRVAAGVASDLDLNAARSARADAALALTELERQRRVIEHQLAQLCGQAGLRLAPGDLLSLPMPPLPPAGLPSSLLERRPDVRAAEQTLLAANARIGVAKAAMFPSISLTGIAGGQSKDFNNLMQLPARIWTLGFGISLPLFDAGRNAARVEQAEARQRQSVAGYQKAVEAAFRETADALSNVALASEAEKAWQERLDSARHSLRLSMLRYEAGYSSYLEVLDAQRTANDTELGFIRNRQSRLAFSVDLMKALGGGWTP